MFLFPLAYFAGADLSAGAVAANLIWVTLGNVLGGAGGVALAYRHAFQGGKP
jgi:formate/nitrite transporter FocA (FNT family)